ncbi:uncharacterized protein LOC130717367 isoform X2 [Lotus japonicus]|uniref:uncharacterized protein LOC130717367 isoform X2 n=1 Tax=Lotus japonicus TaxID=34305 RepID=UPI00258DDFDB|nr:uncharacterized protein LOC130717367 isoform X2 [Lotus japonicus]
MIQLHSRFFSISSPSPRNLIMFRAFHTPFIISHSTLRIGIANSVHHRNRLPFRSLAAGNTTGSAAFAVAKSVTGFGFPFPGNGVGTSLMFSTRAVDDDKAKKRAKAAASAVVRSKGKGSVSETVDNVEPAAVSLKQDDDKVAVKKKKTTKKPATSKKEGKTSATKSSQDDAGAKVPINSSSKGKKKNVKESLAKSTVEEIHDDSASTKSKEKNGSSKEEQGKPPLKFTTKPLYPPLGKAVVVVESVTKAKVIQKYLGDTYEVLPSYGHVRDLAARSGSVRPDDDFSMVWEVPSAAWTHLKSFKVALSGAEVLILASDPDREGEAIAWHILEMLQQQGALHDNISVARVVFHEITEQSIKGALQAPREIDVNLVHAYLARRALDYLIGFNISPLLWKKLPGCQSAGRVQSAALSLICDREMEIDKFKPQEYWTVEAQLRKKELISNRNLTFSGHLTCFDSKKLTQFSITSDTEARDIESKLKSTDFKVISLKRNKVRRNPPTPYITSTLQQDAANKLHFTASHTMKLAQKLYEGVELADGVAEGLITYIRTDGFHISDGAVANIRSLIIERYGQNFAARSPPKYFKKVKNAQEAHEAIRPTDIHKLPSMLAGVLDEESLKLYTLIWSRTVSCQMEPAIFEQVQLDIGNADMSIMLRSASSKVEFPGYRAAFEDIDMEVVQDKHNDRSYRDQAFEVLNSIKTGDLLHLVQAELNQHHTQPPPRYSEASLVKKLEELGIGRPSTYASTIKVLKDRNYVTVKSRVLSPEFRGRMVSAFLSHHFSEVMDYNFTADMETELDNVSGGLTEWKGLLRDYWTRFKSYCDSTSNVHIHQVEKMLEKKFGQYLFASLRDQKRVCPSCMEGTLIFKVSRFGAGYFIGCDQHPRCKYIAKTLYGVEEDEDAPQPNTTIEEPKVLGVISGSNEKVLFKSGPYGCYVQLGEDRKGYAPKRASVPSFMNANNITLEDGLELLRYPLTLGKHPKDGRPVILRLSQGGFTVKHRSKSFHVPKDMNPRDVTFEKALKFLLGDNVTNTGRPKSKPKVEEDEAVEAFY